jgi:hypothetical protein
MESAQTERASTGGTMKNGRNAAITAAIACILSAPLAIGLQAARADELADLRANQELLQQRLDQLAQAPISPVGGLYPGGAPAATAGAGIVGGSFPRSFLIPGTDTSIRVGGAITFNAMHFFNGGNPNTTTASTTNFGNNGALNAIPLHFHTVGPPTFALAGNPARSRGASITYFSAQQSKVNFETRTPTAWGEARTFMEFDWANGNQFVPGNNALMSTDNLLPRLRFAYATLGGLLGGQANSNFADPDAGSDNINFGGLTGDPGVTRIPQVRYTVPLAPWGWLGAWSVSAEAPETEGWTLGSGSAVLASDATCNAVGNIGTTGCTVAGQTNPFKAPSPDLTTAWYIPQPWGHVDFSAVVRPALQVKDGAFVNRTFTGYGVHFSGDVKPGWFGWAKDYITWQFTWGDGIGRYMSGNTTEFALITNYPAVAPASVAAANNVRIRTTVSWGGGTSYQHWWTPTLRSNVGFGILHHDINNLGGSARVCPTQVAAAAGAGGCGLNKELVAAEVNLIWNPVPFADIGIEYFWGHRLVLGNLKGDENGLISRFRVNF